MYKLSQEQLKIIQYNKSSLNISAGPGTGKTTVLTERIKCLINKLNILSENILILSFNKIAVEEIEKRLLIENVKIMTFHGLSASILKKNINLFNNKFNDNFEIIDDLKKENIIKHLLKSDNLFSTSAGFCEVKYGIYKVKNNINNLENIKNNYFYYKYCNYLKENNLIDFDDLNKYIYQLFLNEKYLLIDFQSKYKYILIDEIQDINFYQYQLIKLLSQKSILFIVGDLNQSIYSFRGSKNIYIDLLIQNFNMPTFYLKTNYRSSNKIIKLANNLINYNYEAKNKDKYKIKSFIKDDSNNKVFYHNFVNCYIENTFVASTIKELINSNEYKYSDIVVLYRKKHLSEKLKDIFSVFKIPYLIKGINKKTSIINFPSCSKNTKCILSKYSIEELNLIKVSLLKIYQKSHTQQKNSVLLSTIYSSNKRFRI